MIVVSGDKWWNSYAPAGTLHDAAAAAAAADDDDDDDDDDGICDAGALCRLLGGEDEQRSAYDNEDADVDVCGLGEVESDTSGRIDDVLNVMKTLRNDDTPTTTTTATTTTTTSGLNVSAGQSTALIDSDVDFDGLLSTISDDQIACTSSVVAATVSSVAGADCLLTPTELTDTDQHYMFYPSAHTDELIDTFLRSADEEETTAVYSELQAVQLTAEDWSAADSLSDAQMGGMLVEFDSSLLTIIELENDQTPAACLTMTPGGCASQVVNGETTTWNVLQGLEVSQFQVVGSEQSAVEDAVNSSPAPEEAVVDDAAENAAEDGGSAGDVRNAEPTPGSESNAANVADDGPAGEEVKTDAELASVDGAATSDDEYVLIVDCVDGADAEVEYEIVDETDKVETDSSTAESTEQRQDEVVTANDDCSGDQQLAADATSDSCLTSG